MANFNYKMSDLQLKKELLKMYPADIAVLFENSEEAFQDQIFKVIDKKTFSKVIPELVTAVVIKFFRRISDKDRKIIMELLESDDLKTILDLYDLEEQQKYLSLLSKQNQIKLAKLLSYEEDNAASIMSTDYISIDRDLSIKEATNYVITSITDKAYIDTLFVVDKKKLLGIIDIKDLIIARPNDDINEIMESKFPYVLEKNHIDLAISKIKDYDINVLPVLNENHELLGIITADDVLDKMAEEHESDYQALVAVTDHTDELPPIKRSIQRLPWLLTSVILNLLIASFLTIFHATLEEVVALVLFQPMILGMAGNIGTQSLAVTILGIHSEEIKPRHHVFKELLISFTNSLIIGIIAVAIVWLFLYIIPAEHVNATRISIVVGLSLFSSMFLSGMAGVFIPIILNKLGIDEAIASGPLISTVNDFTALGSYFLIATLLLIS